MMLINMSICLREDLFFSLMYESIAASLAD